MQILKKTQPSHNVDKQMFNAAGVLLQFLASPEEVGDAICLIRGTMPPGVVVPLHKHAEIELLYVLEGSLEFFMAKAGYPMGYLRPTRCYSYTQQRQARAT